MVIKTEEMLRIEGYDLSQEGPINYKDPGAGGSASDNDPMFLSLQRHYNVSPDMRGLTVDGLADRLLSIPEYSRKSRDERLEVARRLKQSDRP